MLAATLRLGPRSSAADFVALASRAAAGETRRQQQGRGPAAAGRRIARNGKKKEKKREREEKEREKEEKVKDIFFVSHSTMSVI
jgi:hypothetical protein